MVKLRELSSKLENSMSELVDVFTSETLLVCEASEQTGKFTKVSQGWLNEFGYTEEEVYAQPWLYFVHSEDQGKTEATAKAMSEGHFIKGFKNRYRKKSGEYVTLLWGAPAFKNGISYANAIVLPESGSGGI